ncbi:hypothetical protein BJ508DRAFT_334941 [Ascobolus immersus RN42]|uniref:Uncharacterized protein n=1 Tax=Ascobolus immersus RN42 TaxID=1160509 RepID=A0A3N4HIQ6_ASCIM|nr:hypothetical protein BJ508DRAFT_334941 [Ascobolus immersus RN42]
MASLAATGNKRIPTGYTQSRSSGHYQDVCVYSTHGLRLGELSNKFLRFQVGNGINWGIVHSVEKHHKELHAELGINTANIDWSIMEYIRRGEIIKTKPMKSKLTNEEYIDQVFFRGLYHNLNLSEEELAKQCIKKRLTCKQQKKKEKALKMCFSNHTNPSDQQYWSIINIFVVDIRVDYENEASFPLLNITKTNEISMAKTKPTDQRRSPRRTRSTRTEPHQELKSHRISKIRRLNAALAVAPTNPGPTNPAPINPAHSTPTNPAHSTPTHPALPESAQPASSAATSLNPDATKVALAAPVEAPALPDSSDKSLHKVGGQATIQLSVPEAGPKPLPELIPLTVDKTPYYCQELYMAERANEGLDDHFRVQFFPGYEIPSCHPLALCREVLAALPQKFLGIWRVSDAEFPIPSGMTGKGGGLFHQSLDLNEQPEEARDLLRHVAKSFSIVLALCKYLELNGQEMVEVTGGKPITILYVTPAFYTPEPWDVWEEVNEDPASYFPKCGPFFSTRYNPGSEKDVDNFKRVLKAQEDRLDREIAIKKAGERRVKAGRGRPLGALGDRLNR